MPDRTFTIVRARSADYDLARQAVVEVHAREISDAADLLAFLSDPACYLLLAVDDGRVAGSLRGYALRRPDRSEPQFLLYAIDVRAECRNRGIGTALVEHFITEARTPVRWRYGCRRVSPTKPRWPRMRIAGFVGRLPMMSC